LTLWSICWRLSRRRSEYVVRGLELELEPVRAEEGNVREMAKKQGDRVKEIVSGLDFWIWIRIRNRLDWIALYIHLYMNAWFLLLGVGRHSPGWVHQQG
jgi:hypothetical protein